MKLHQLLVLVTLALAADALASARVVQFRSVEDPAYPPDPAVCARAPFRVNARLGGSLWVTRTRADNGQVINDSVQRIGFATACVQLTNFTFPAGLQQNFYGEFTLPQGVFAAVGTCTLISNNVPKAGLVLAGCNLRLVKFPDDYSGGAITSLSVFNPFRLRGFNTGSSWTLQVYDSASSAEDTVDHSAHDQDLQDMDDTRTDDQIAAMAAAMGN